MRVTISRKAFIAFCVALSILIALSAYSYINSHQLIDYGREVSHTNKALYLTGQVLSATLEMEAGQLRYNTTGDSTFLKAYPQTVTDLNEHINELLALTITNTEQQTKIKYMQSLVARKINSSEKAIAAYGSSADVSGGRVNTMLTDSIRYALESIEKEEKKRLTGSEEKSEVRITLFNTTSIGLLIIAMGVLIGFFLTVNNTLNVHISTENKIKELNKELEAFTYSVSHDLRAPLRSVSGYARILKEDYHHALDEEGNRIIGVIQKNANTMGALIDDLLEFSRVGRKELVKSKVNMDELVRSLVRDLQLGGAAADFRIHTIHSGNADVTMIRQVWTHLLSNAVKFSHKRSSPRIEINSSVTTHEIEYSIRDNGTGFNMEYAHKLFHVFQRLHKVQDYEGTGIGLALVKRIINRHGGNVRAEGRENDGATFYFTLPQ